MKLFVSYIFLLVFTWNSTIETSMSKKDSICQSISTELENNWNKDFIGLWVNEDEQKSGMTKCKISYSNNSFIVQMWARCQPQDCDWGENVSNKIDEEATKFELLWDQVFAESAITYEIVDNKLKVTNKRRFKDGSGRQEYTLIEYFIKQ